MNRIVQFFFIFFMCSFSLKFTIDRSLTLKESVIVGGAVGAAEVAFPGQLLSYAMNSAIKKEPFVWSRSYQGFLVNAGGQMPITAVQKLVQVKGAQCIETFQGHKLSDSQKGLVSFAAGVAGAVIDTPSNAIQLYLQKKSNVGKSMLNAYKDLGGKGCFRGFMPNAFMKEAPFTIGYQILAQKGEKVAQEYVDNKLVAAAIGGTGAGVFTAIATHPGAVVRNKMQGDPFANIYTTTLKTVQKICQEEGIQGLFFGLKQRGLRVAIAVPLYVVYTNFLEEFIKNSGF